MEYVHTEKTFSNTVDEIRNRPARKKDGVNHTHGRPDDINMSSIYTTLIHEAGRWVERYASDLLFDIKAIDEAIKKNPVESRQVVAIGLRKDGCDGNSFVISRLRDTKRPLISYVNPEQVYRKLFLVEIDKDKSNEVYVELHNVTTDLRSLAQEDEKN